MKKQKWISYSKVHFPIISNDQRNLNPSLIDSRTKEPRTGASLGTARGPRKLKNQPAPINREICGRRGAGIPGHLVNFLEFNRDESTRYESRLTRAPRTLIRTTS